MAKSKKAKSNRKRSGGIGKGPKLFLIVFLAAIFFTLAYKSYDAFSEFLVQSRQIEVSVDLEVSGFGGEVGPFKEPWCVAVGGNGHFFVSDFSARRILEFGPNGEPINAFGKPGKDPGQFNQPSGLYVEPSGDIWVCDSFNQRLQKFDPKGKSLKIVEHSFFGPKSIAGNGTRLYVSDTGNHKIKVFDMEGRFIQEWGKPGKLEGEFNEPMGVTLDPEGFVYVADSDNMRIQKFESNGKFVAAFRVASWGGKNVETPYLAFQNGSLYASNASKGTILKFDPTGKLLAVLLRKGNFPAAAGVAVDAQGRVYVVEKGNGKVARLTIPSDPGK